MLTLIARFVHGCSTRNIDTIQIIDLNFLTKQNAFEENQIFELLTTTFLGLYLQQIIMITKRTIL